MDKDIFRKRLTELRMNKGVSARDMSLSIGQSPGYINNIENGVSLPSLTVFFYICDYLDVTPSSFFDVSSSDPTRLSQLQESAKALSKDNLDLLIELSKALGSSGSQIHNLKEN